MPNGTAIRKDGLHELSKNLCQWADYRACRDTWILAVNMTRLVPSLRDPHIFLPAYREVLQSLRNGLHLQSTQSHQAYHLDSRS